ncbi:MAG: methyltransferase domain-containing protein, partial [bacterium]|nr:methyltransferase domain-containing protein [bacterium]
MDASAHYNKEYFDWQRIVGESGGKINLSKFEQYISLEDTVLDFGCGGGYLLKELSCAKKIGVDVSEHARATCKENGIDEVYASLDEVPDGSVDKVITNHALEHAERPLDVLRELHRVLVPGGMIVVALPIDDYRSAPHYDPNDTSNHLYTWNIQLFGNCLNAAGFTNIAAWVYTHAWPGNYRKHFDTLPRPVFDVLCWLTAVRRNR